MLNFYNFNLIKIFIIFVFILGISLPAQSKPVDNLKLYTESYPPYNFKKNNKIQGISVDLMAEMLKITGSKLSTKNINLVPWARAYAKVLLEKNSVLFVMTRTDYRENLFKWVGPINNTTIGLTARKDRKIIINNFEELKKYKIGVIIKDVGQQLLINRNFPKKKLFPVTKIIQNIKMLNSGRIDLWSYETIVAKWAIKHFGFNPDDYEVVYILDKSELYFAFNKDTDDIIIKQMQNALDEIKKNGTYKKIINKYLDK